MKKGEKLHRPYRTARAVLSVLTAFLFAVSALGTFLLAADGLAEQSARFVPDYEKADLTPLLEKEVWSEEDYALVYRQTGLTRTGADSVSRRELKTFQDAFFYEGEVYHDFASIITPHDRLRNTTTGADVTAPIVPLQDGDVIVSSSTHLFGWRHGHAALVTDGPSRSVLQSISIGIPSAVNENGAGWFRRSANFMVLRLKATEEQRARIAERAEKELVGLNYNVFVGYFLPKDQCKNGRTPASTQCSHLVWQAFMNEGYDVDPTGGPLVSPADLANSPLFEVVQIYGFDPDKLWN